MRDRGKLLRLIAGTGRASFDRRDRLDEGGELVGGDAALDGDPLDAALLQAADQRAERVESDSRLRAMIGWPAE
ncbi:MAG: hypothetical protein DMF93_20430 [Acidobacteria bacterium]|nr:MAG: hypothetical protein DMF93_20430 [Acidobacteriota bacterium]